MNKDQIRNLLMTGTYVILIAMCFKIAESSMRMFNK